MILVDTSVWIDYFRGVVTPQSEKTGHSSWSRTGVYRRLDIDRGLARIRQRARFQSSPETVGSIPLVPLVGEDIALQAARNLRKLGALGITIRKTIDTLIATSCIEKELSLLYSDRDFDPFVQHLGLRSAN